MRFDSNQQGRGSVSPYLDGFDAIGSGIQYLQLAADTVFNSSRPTRSSLLLEFEVTDRFELSGCGEVVLSGYMYHRCSKLNESLP